MTLYGDVLDDILQEEYDYVSSCDQMFNYVEREISEMWLDTMDSTYVFIPQCLIEGDILL